MEFNEPVSTIMTKSVIVANKSHNFSEVLELFSKHGMHHLPMVDDNNQMIGIISSNDIMKLFTNPKYKNLTLEQAAMAKGISISEIMTSDPVSIPSTLSVKQAAKVFAEKKFLSLPVVDGGTLVGILTTKDIMQLVAYFS